jgi:Kef-type K+ transport systems, membrane components
VVGVIVYAAVMLSVIRPVIHRWTARIADAEGRMAVLLIAAIASAAATDRLGVHPLFGAFFLGALAPRDQEVERLLTVRIEPLVASCCFRCFSRSPACARTCTC